MRYPASEKIEIILLVEQSALLARKTLDRLGVPGATFYRWYDQYQTSAGRSILPAEPHLASYPRGDTKPDCRVSSGADGTIAS